MNQYYLFLILLTITVISLIYQSIQFKNKVKETYSNKRILEGKVSLNSPDITIDIGSKSPDDTLIKSTKTLYVKDSILFGINTIFGVSTQIKLDEDMLKKIKSFSEIYYFDSSKGQKLCLQDKEGKEVCCDKKYLGVLTGQTPFKLRLAKPKPTYEDNEVNKDQIYESIKTPKDGNKTTFYDKNFVMLSNDMKQIKSPQGISQDILFPVVRFEKTQDSDDFDFKPLPNVFINSGMTGFTDKNYYCYMPNNSPDITS